MDTNTSSEASFSYTQTAVPVFTGEKYEYWCVKMKTLFLSQGLWDLVQAGPQALDPDKAPETTTVQFSPEARMNDARALFLIQQGVSDTIFPQIMGAATAKEAWETLKEEFRGSSKVIRVKLQAFWREYDFLQMKQGEAVAEFAARTINIINEIKCLGDHIDDKEIVPKILRSLPPSFDPIVVAIEESKDLTTLTMTELMVSLKSHEDRLKRRAEEVPTKAYQPWKPAVKSRGRGKPHFHPLEKHTPIHEKQPPHCIICNKSNHESKQCYFKRKRCKIPNHSERDCCYKKQAGYTEQEKGESDEGKDDGRLANDDSFWLKLLE